jgi:hypothetical protein
VCCTSKIYSSLENFVGGGRQWRWCQGWQQGQQWQRRWWRAVRQQGWPPPGRDKGQGQGLGKGQNQNNNDVGEGDSVMASEQVRQRGQHDGIFSAGKTREIDRGSARA